MEAMDMNMQARAVSQRTLIVAVVIAVLVGVAVGLLVAPDGATRTERLPATEEVGPREIANGVPVGYARTAEGAVAAATNFGLASTNETLIRDGNAYVRGIRTTAAAAWLEEAEERAKRGYEFAVDYYGSDIHMMTGVLRYRVLSFDRDHAVVRLWTVTVATGTNRPLAESVWGTSTISLEWDVEEDDWRMTGSKDEMGPVPTAAQAAESAETATRLMEELSAFKEGPRP
jgi:hypothetical protein